MLKGAKKDGKLVTSGWDKLVDLIDGVRVREVRHVPGDQGVITEAYRPEWDPTGLPVVHVYQSRLFPGAIGAWSCHAKNVDRLFVNQGHARVVLLMLNMPSNAYDYEDPDHYRLPFDTPEIPYSWTGRTVDRVKGR